MGSSIRIEKGTTIIDVVGQIDLGSSPAFRRTLLESLKGTNRVAVNLIAVKYIDSSGIASLLEVLKEARQSKKRLVLFGLTAAVGQVLQLTRLTGVLKYANRGAGTRSLIPASDGRPASKVALQSKAEAIPWGKGSCWC